MMERDTGDKTFPIWLLGDSNPANWQDSLGTPLDARHPARHNIWTSVVDVTQDRIFRESRRRIDTSRLYTRNAIGDPRDKPHDGAVNWSSAVESECRGLSGLISKYAPLMLISFGSFAFEFARRAIGEVPHRTSRHWTTRRLGDEFRDRSRAVQPNATVIMPLLHVTIARRHFLKSHSYFTAQENDNYFDYVGTWIADVLTQQLEDEPIWIE